MTSPTEPRTLQLYQALKITGLGIALIYGFQLVFAIAGVSALVGSMFGDLVTAGLLLGFAHRRGIDLGLRVPASRFLVAGVLVGLSAWYVAMLIVTWLQPPGSTDTLQKIVEQGSFVPSLIGLALMPAIAEELVFRGALARGLATRWPTWAAVLVSGTAFAVYHMLPSQMVGVLPLGLALGLLAVRSNSVLPGMLAHLTNNAIALVLSRNELPALSVALVARPEITLVAALVLLGCGVMLAAKGPA